MKGQLFTEEQVRYLNTLPAVTNATACRITYSRSFKLECLCRNRQGESPTMIFRNAGLPPSLVGSKRIERSFARWRSDPSLTDILNGIDLPGVSANTHTEGSNSHTHLAPVDHAIPAADTARWDTAAASAATTEDPRDVIIREQALYIIRLENQLMRRL